MTNAEFTDQTKDEIRRAIAESNITDGDLTNQDIDQLVDLFEAWFQRNIDDHSRRSMAGYGARSAEQHGLWFGSSPTYS